MCLVGILGWFAPRLTLLLLWLLTTWVDTVQPWWLAVAGWILAPYLTLTYVVVEHYGFDTDSFVVRLCLVAALVIDLTTYVKSRRKSDD